MPIWLIYIIGGAGIAAVGFGGGMALEHRLDLGTINGQQVTITQLTANNGTLKGNYAECKKGSDDLQASADAMKARGDAIQAALDKAARDAATAQQKTAQTIASLRAQVVPVADKACAGAFSILTGRQ